MKTKLTFALILAITSVVFLTGCNTDGNPVSHALGNVISAPSKFLDFGAKTLTEVVTNVTPQTVVTSREVVTPKEIVTATGTNTVNFTNYVNVTNTFNVTNLTAVPKEVLTTTANTGQMISGFLPAPYGEIGTLIFGGLSALTAAAAKRRQKVLNATVLGVEAATKQPTLTADSLKDAISDASKLAGVADDLHAVVKKLTS
jgi:hypothetical protein